MTIHAECAQEMDTTFAKEARERTEAKKRAKIMAETEARRKADADERAKLDKEKIDEEKRRAGELKKLEMAKKEAKMKAEADARAKQESEDEKKAAQSKLIIEIKKEIVTEIEMFRSNSEAQFQEMKKAIAKVELAESVQKFQDPRMASDVLGIIGTSLLFALIISYGFNMLG